MNLFLKKSVRILGVLVLAGAVLASLFIGGAYLYLSPRLPSIESLKDVQLQVPLRVYAKSGELIAEFGEMKRTPLKYEEFPKHLVNAVLAAEDDRFFEHPGVDYQGILHFACRCAFSANREKRPRRKYYNHASGAKLFPQS